MNVSRVTVYDALFTLMQSYIQDNYSDYANMPQFQTFSKNWLGMAKSFSGAQPAFYLAAGPEMPDQQTTPGICRWELVFKAYVLMTLDPLSESPSPSEVLLSTLDMIDDSLFNNGQPQNLASQNHGKPLVYNTFLDRRNGKIEIIQPSVSSQAAMLVPITVITGTQFNGTRSNS